MLISNAYYNKLHFNGYLIFLIYNLKTTYGTFMQFPTPNAEKSKLYKM